MELFSDIAVKTYVNVFQGHGLLERMQNCPWEGVYHNIVLNLRVLVLNQTKKAEISDEVTVLAGY